MQFAPLDGDPWKGKIVGFGSLEIVQSDILRMLEAAVLETLIDERTACEDPQVDEFPIERCFVTIEPRIPPGVEESSRKPNASNSFTNTA
jgi:hypothetical protein